MDEINNKSEILKRKSFIKNIYSKNWVKKRKQYKFSNYDKSLIDLILIKRKNYKLLEVALGDGYPFSSFFVNKGHDVYGIDISDFLVSKVKEKLPSIKVYKCDSEDLLFDNNKFDITFCFRSTWYFTDLIKSISEMLRVTKKNGEIFFDIQNKNNVLHKKLIKKRKSVLDQNFFLFSIKKFFFNIIKIILSPFKFYNIDWNFDRSIIIENPTDPLLIIQKFKNKNIKIYGVNWNKKKALKKLNIDDSLDDYDRLVFQLTKI